VLYFIEDAARDPPKNSTDLKQRKRRDFKWIGRAHANIRIALVI